MFYSVNGYLDFLLRKIPITNTIARAKKKITARVPHSLAPSFCFLLISSSAAKILPMKTEIMMIVIRLRLLSIVKKYFSNIRKHQVASAHIGIICPPGDFKTFSFSHSACVLRCDETARKNIGKVNYVYGSLFNFCRNIKRVIRMTQYYFHPGRRRKDSISV